MESQLERLWKSRFWPSRLTAILLLSVAGAWTWANVVENDADWAYEGFAYTHHGYPCDAVITYDYNDLAVRAEKRVQCGFAARTTTSSDDSERFCCNIVTSYASAVLIPSGLIVDILLGLGLMLLAVFLSKLLSYCHLHSWFQFHLSTAVLMLAASGLLLGVNIARTEDRGDEQTHRTYFRGWPWRAYEEYASFGSESQFNDDAEPYVSRWYARGLALNLALALSLIFSLTLLCERLLPVLRLHPMTIIALVVVAGGLLVANSTRRAVIVSSVEQPDLHQELAGDPLPERAGLWQGNEHGWPYPCCYNLWSYGNEHDNAIHFSFSNLLIDFLAFVGIMFSVAFIFERLIGAANLFVFRVLGSDKQNVKRVVDKVNSMP